MQTQEDTQLKCCYTIQWILKKTETISVYLTISVYWVHSSSYKVLPRSQMCATCCLAVLSHQASDVWLCKLSCALSFPLILGCGADRRLLPRFTRFSVVISQRFWEILKECHLLHKSRGAMCDSGLSAFCIVCCPVLPSSS